MSLPSPSRGTRLRLTAIAREQERAARWVRRARRANAALGAAYVALMVTTALLLADWLAQAWTVMGGTP